MSYNTDLQSHNKELRDILAAVNDLPDAGSPSEGVELPTLTNPGDGAKLLEGYELIDQNGEVVQGAMKNNCSADATLDLDNLSTVVPEGYTQGGTIEIDPEIPAEIDVHTDLIAQISAALEGKAAGGGGLPTQEKTVEITTNGTHEIVPDDGYALSKVTATVFVASDAERDVAALLNNSMVNLTNSVVTTLKSRALQGSTKLVAVYLPNVSTIGTYAFYACSGLVSVVLPKLTSVPSQAFYACSKLKYADLGLTSSIAAQAFNANTALETMILRRTGSICTLSNTSAVSNTGIAQGKGYFYVPAALIESYKANTNWSNYSAQFRTIEDYPDICGGAT